MTMKFCPLCKTLLIPQGYKGESSEGFFVFCKDCGYFEDLNENNNENGYLKTRDKIPKKAEKGEGVHSSGNVFASYPNVCKKCGYEKAEVIDIGFLYSDEDGLFLLKCGKCGYSERIGRKTV